MRQLAEWFREELAVKEVIFLYYLRVYVAPDEFVRVELSE